jgi:hypothetical protein
LARIATAMLVLGLLGGTAAAFAVTEGLKLEKNPVSGVRVDTFEFAPSCDCATRKAHFSIRLRNSDRVRLDIVHDGHVVRTLVFSRRFSRGWHAFTWNGRDDFGAFVPEGTYRPKIHLAGKHRTIVLPNDLRVDRTPPRIVRVSFEPRRISPDGDGRRDAVVVRYRTSEPAHGLLFVDRTQRVRTRSQKEVNSLKFSGMVGGRSLPAGSYQLTLAAEDRAGNVSRTSRAAIVVVRYISLARRTVRARAGFRFGVGVRTDARSYRWRFAGRSGSTKARVLVLRAPRTPGRYRLFVEERGHAARVVVVVRPRGRR